MSHPHMLTTNEVAGILQVSVATLKAWRAEGKGPPWLRVGSLVRYDPEALAEWLKAQTKE